MALSLASVPNNYDLYCKTLTAEGINVDIVSIDTLTVNTVNSGIVNATDVNSSEIITPQITNNPSGNLTLSGTENIIITAPSSKNININGVVRQTNPGLAINDTVSSNNTYSLTVDPNIAGPSTVNISANNTGAGAGNLAIAAKTAINLNSPFLGFYNTTASSRQNITGSRGGNAALASLLTALAGYGLIIDNTTV